MHTSRTEVDGGQSESNCDAYEHNGGRRRAVGEFVMHTSTTQADGGQSESNCDAYEHNAGRRREVGEQL
ncbi:hypothetical protein D3H35_19195 [Cohnella faecalis]|uniref:Uncharacterized protein n=1 Tax=Cohnella faecalis TaxID=2315694 RepID=A0A398CSJ2_9BACL|nr:hypothetical protein D3H35_19195 [Cohnella faecalis]